MQALQFRFADFLDECLLLLSTKGKIYYANRAALNLLQTTAETIVGQDLTSLLRNRSETVNEFFHHCSGTREFVPGGLTFSLPTGNELICRCDGAGISLDNGEPAILLKIRERRSLRGLDALAGGGTMGALIRKNDWSKSPLGRLESWPQSLLTAASICLSSKFPMILWWGKELCVLYNDAYIPIFGAKHPNVLGKSGFEAWGEVWDVIGPMLRGVLNNADATWSDDQLLLLHRNGYLEETYFTWSYSPIRDEGGGVGGVFSAVFETTSRVLTQRRLRTLRELSVNNAKSTPEACQSAVEIIKRNNADIPFAMLYLRSGTDAQVKLIAHSGISAEAAAQHATVASLEPWAIEKVLASQEAVTIQDPGRLLGKISGGTWPEQPLQAVGLPIMGSEQGRALGVVILGVNPRRALDDDYRGFQQLVARQISVFITSAKAYEEERKRAEALAEIDRAKTTFFSNVSHEFRTPLTLMIGPVDDALSSSERALSGENLAAVHRNGLRLLKLVNTILDFSRIEAGRIDATYEPTDLSALTAELASSFQSAMSRAGIHYVVDCATKLEHAYVDRDMWEKIVLNLVSNAFKFTLKGQIRVSLNSHEDKFELIVADTGIGIPQEEMPHIFERFHRVKGAGGRTMEGTGIGLALVHELVRLHAGIIKCDSEIGKGTKITVSIPKGSSHLPKEKIGVARTLTSTALGANAYLEEALRWLPAETLPSPGAPRLQAVTHEIAPHSSARNSSTPQPKVLIADDNADMREYLTRLLIGQFQVRTVTDGHAAVEAVKYFKPDLILSDVMMPVLDGFHFLKILRNDPATSTIPFILLSARAGEEAKIEGLQAGADDYLVKPFNARELVARVTAHLDLARVRKEAAERERELRELAEQALGRERMAREEADKANRSKDEFLAVVSHELRTPLTPILGWTRILQSKDVAPSMLEKGLSIINRNVQSQTKLIEDLLDISRIVSNKIRLEYSNVGIPQVIEGAIDAVRHAADAKNIRIKFIMEESTGPVWGDPDRLKQVFWNLLTNAVKFSNDGGTIEIQLRKAGGNAHIDVVDTGIGIDASFILKVFDRFSQFDSTTTRKYGGLGIGLSVVRQLVELHGGKVRVSSAGANKGATFTVELPISDAGKVIQEQDRTFITKPGHEELIGKSILVVDDEEDAREFLRFALERSGAKVIAASSAEEAISACAAKEFDVVVTDIGMPGQDGFQLLRQLRKSGMNMPAIAVTAFARSEDRWRALSEGFHRHISKPVDPDELCAAVSGSLRPAS